MCLKESPRIFLNAIMQKFCSEAKQFLQSHELKQNERAEERPWEQIESFETGRVSCDIQNVKFYTKIKDFVLKPMINMCGLNYIWKL